MNVPEFHIGWLDIDQAEFLLSKLEELEERVRSKARVNRAPAASTAASLDRSGVLDVLHGIAYTAAGARRHTIGAREIQLLGKIGHQFIESGLIESHKGASEHYTVTAYGWNCLEAD